MENNLKEIKNFIKMFVIITKQRKIKIKKTEYKYLNEFLDKFLNNFLNKLSKYIFLKYF